MIHRISAFTLIELLVTMSLMAIIFAIGAPLFSQFQTSSRLNSSAQTFETIISEAFSSARSRPECFVIEGKQGEEVFTMTSFADRCREKVIERTFELNSGVEISRDFEITFSAPFGDISFGTEGTDQEVSETAETEIEEMEIKLCNTECVAFMIYGKSGLVTRIPHTESDD